jgi:uncharacterized membrane protein
MWRHFTDSDILFVMFGGFALSYGTVISQYDVDVGLTVFFLGVVILSLWGILFSKRRVKF